MPAQQKYFQHQLLHPLLNKGLMVMTLPDKPTSLMTPCGDPALLPDDADLRDVLMAHADDVETIRICKERGAAKDQWIENLYQ